MKRILFLALLFMICLPIGYFILKDGQLQKQLPVINPVDVQSELVDSSIMRQGRGHRVGQFRFQNQDGNWIDQQEMIGKVSVVEYFFTTCKSICPIMNTQMQGLQKRFANRSTFKIFSFTVDPETDTVAQLKRYAQAHNYKSGQWHFLTGSKSDLYALARTSFFVLKPAEAQNLGDAGNDFIHTNNFVLIDQHLRIRGYYDGTNSKEVEALAKDIRTLLKDH
ncbi:MAG: hypothetical protein RLZZ301_1460 [Bacteroidota bacterium]|jgi:protein SCO1/2